MSYHFGEEEENYLILGPTGYGKSTTGNTLVDDNLFACGNDVKRITESVNIVKANSRVVIDSPGFADPNDEKIFLTEFLKVKKDILELAPLKVLLVIKFDLDQSKGFLKASQELIKYFGSEVLDSTIVLFVQGNDKKIFSKGDFIKIIQNSDGYKYLNEQKNNNVISYCLWDNFIAVKGQEESFQKAVKNLQPFSRINLNFSFKLIQNEFDHLKHISEKFKNEELKIKRDYLNNLRIMKADIASVINPVSITRNNRSHYDYRENYQQVASNQSDQIDNLIQTSINDIERKIKDLELKD